MEDQFEIILLSCRNILLLTLWELERIGHLWIQKMPDLIDVCNILSTKTTLIRWTWEDPSISYSGYTIIIIIITSNPHSLNLATAAFFGYNAMWEFENDGAAFVDGDMYFNQTEQKLYVSSSICGYYYISSQVYFQANSHDQSYNYVRHEINIERKCNDKDIILRSYSSFPAASDDSFLRRSTTHAGGVVKMCKGGSIFVVIPSNQPCCPIGVNPSTHLSVFMIAETTCESQRVI